MTRNEMIALVERYFAAVDAKNLDGALATLAPDCRFTIETDALTHEGRDEAIRGMFERLFARWDEIWHGNFRHVADPEGSRVASQFDVRNIAADGTVHTKRNCNFFTVEDGRFAAISVYMSGENTLK